jgi:hypothetical protein
LASELVVEQLHFFNIYRTCLCSNLDRMLGLGVGPFIDHGLHGGVPYLPFGEEASPDGELE